MFLLIQQVVSVLINQTDAEKSALDESCNLIISWNKICKNKLLLHWFEKIVALLWNSFEKLPDS